MMTRHTGASVELYSTAKSVLATAVMAPAAYLAMGRVSTPLARLGIAVLVGLAVYAAVAYALGALTEEDLRMFRTALAIARQKNESRDGETAGTDPAESDERGTGQ